MYFITILDYKFILLMYIHCYLQMRTEKKHPAVKVLEVEDVLSAVLKYCTKQQGGPKY